MDFIVAFNVNEVTDCNYIHDISVISDFSRRYSMREVRKTQPEKPTIVDNNLEINNNAMSTSSFSKLLILTIKTINDK